MEAEIARFEQYLKQRYPGRSTAKHYVSDIRLFAQVVQVNTARAVKAMDVDRFVTQQVAQKRRPATITRRLASLHTFFEYLASQEPDEAWPNPVVWRRHGIKRGHHLPRDASEAAVARLFATIQDLRDRAMFGLMLLSGLRVGEVAELRLEDVTAPETVDGLAGLRVRGKGDKERRVWLSASGYHLLRQWLAQRPASAEGQIFLNQHGQPLSVAGIQYRLSEHAQNAGVRLTCHQLRHTFARRLAEQGLPIDSLAKLLGHNQLHTTQGYIDGADPTVRADYAAAIAAVTRPLEGLPGAETDRAWPRPPTETAPDLGRCWERLQRLPDGLGQPVQAYLQQRSIRWRAHVAQQLARHLAARYTRLGLWFAQERHVKQWSELKRSDVEAWVTAQQARHMGNDTVANLLGDLRSLWRFLEQRDLPLDPNLFRVPRPPRTQSLPRFLSESDYRRLEQVVQTETQSGEPAACLHRAWFLTLAHTGVRIGELLNLRLGDLDLVGGRLLVRAGKNDRDRTVFLSAPLRLAAHQYLATRPALADDHLWIADGKVLSVERVRWRLAKWGQQAGVKVSPHRLRHTFATRLLNAGMPIVSLRKLLGHQHIQTTLLYARVYDQTLRSQFEGAMAQIEGIAVSNWPTHPLSAHDALAPIEHSLDSV